MYFQQIHIIDYKLNSHRRFESRSKILRDLSFNLSRGLSFLKTGLILAVFKQSGKLGVSVDLLMQFFKISNIQLQFFQFLTGILPPPALLFFKS